MSVAHTIDEQPATKMLATEAAPLAELMLQKATSIIDEEGTIASAIANSCIADNRYTTELLTSLGQRSAEERIAHLLLTLLPRIAARNVIREQRYPFPLRQQHIADAVGLTSVYVSRIFGLFRERRILVLSEGVLQVFNLPELERIGLLS